MNPDFYFVAYDLADGAFCSFFNSLLNRLAKRVWQGDRH